MLSGPAYADVTHPLIRLWRYAAPHRGRIVLATTLSVSNKVFDVVPEILIGAAVDVIVRGDDSWVADLTGIDSVWSQLVALALVNAVVWLLESATEWGYQLVWRNLAQTVEHEARMDAYSHVQGLELAYFEDQSTGGLMAILNDDVNQLERFLDVGANNIIRTLTNVVLVGIVFLLASPLLALVAFLPIPVILWGSFRYQRRLEPLYRGVRDQVGRLSGTLANNLGGIATIKAFTAEERETERVGRESEAYRVANRDAIRFSSAFVPLIRIAILFGFTMTLLVGGRAVIDGNLEVGFFSVLVFMTQRLLWPLTTLGETFDLYQRAMASTRRILDLLAVRPQVIEGGGRLPRPPAGAVRFEDVRFAYSSGDEVLRGLDLDVPAGETHAVVGLTGAGKSTVVKLLLRLYDATGGRVTVDGIDVRELSFAELRGVIGLVSQDVFLFDGSVRENIAYGDPGARPSASRRPRGWRRRTTSSPPFPSATTRWWASGGRSCREGSASVCRSRGPSCATRPSWCSTRPPRPWTTRPRPRSSGPWSTSPATAPPWSSRTACPPCAPPTASTCWSTAP